ncbi:O-methyltransferase-domain-containing protein [Phyllosticta citricarpa]|uniref:O-methyltransferase-domain-containing protein n=2 Tax=Phyllosticta TaxID=121621 RepID=A0ABR1MM55_9PEZI
MEPADHQHELRSLAANLTAAVDAYASLSHCDVHSRNNLIRLAKQIINHVKEPRETAFEYAVSMAEMGALRVLMDWRALDCIPDDCGISYAELAERVDAEEPLLRRMAWMLVATGMLQQVGADHVAHTKFSKIYRNKDPQGIFFQIMFDEGMVPYTRFSEYFRKYGRKEPIEPTQSPHGFGWGHEGKNFWDIIDGERLEDFNTSMMTLDSVLPVNGMFPFKYVLENAHHVDADAPLVVDVGGGRGQALMRIREECPDIPAQRMVLQDRAEVIEDARQKDIPELRGMKMVPHNFFDPQPSKGALIYYVRRVMHDWSDKYNAQILSHLRDAMTSPHARILITDQIMPSPPTTLPAQTDLCMMGLGAKERTEKDWHALADLSGLEVVKFWRSSNTEVAVIECKKADDARARRQSAGCRYQ